MVLEFDAALAAVMEHAVGMARPTGIEEVELSQGRGRVLAEDVRTSRDQPPFDRSTRDGYAVRARDLAGQLRLLGMVKAGERWTGSALGALEAVEVMTGAPMPEGADAVLMLEHATVADGVLRAAAGRTLGAGENVVRRGSEARAGDVVVRAGAVLNAATIAAVASCGAAKVKVAEVVRVAVVATGDELVSPGESIETWQIYDSNTYALAAMVEEEGGVGERRNAAKDTYEDLRERIAQGSTRDLLVLSGGVSMGKYDLVEEVLKEYGAEFFFTGAKIQPGKPVVFGRLPKGGTRGRASENPWRGEWTYFFGLPGNPVSTEVCFRLFVAPVLRALSGRKDLSPKFVEATVGEVFAGKPGLVRFLPALVESEWRGVTVRPVPWQGSGDVAANGRASAYCVVGESGLMVGDVARVLLR